MSKLLNCSWYKLEFAISRHNDFPGIGNNNILYDQDNSRLQTLKIKNHVIRDGIILQTRKKNRHIFSEYFPFRQLRNIVLIIKRKQQIIISTSSFMRLCVFEFIVCNFTIPISMLTSFFFVFINYAIFVVLQQVKKHFFLNRLRDD